MGFLASVDVCEHRGVPRCLTAAGHGTLTWLVRLRQRHWTRQRLEVTFPKYKFRFCFLTCTRMPRTSPHLQKHRGFTQPWPHKAQVKSPSHLGPAPAPLLRRGSRCTPLPTDCQPGILGFLCTYKVFV